MATPILGKEFSVIYDSSVVAYATSFDFKLNKETIDITSLNSAGWKEVMAGDKDWAVSFDGLVTRTSGDTSRGYDYLMNSLITSDTSVYVAIKPNITGNKYYTGYGFIESMNLKGGVGDKATYSGSVKGTGGLTSATA